ncbi:hypothetical protein V8D89_002823 [Ganoderma adspersum]
MPLYIPSYKYPLVYSPAYHHRGRWPPPVPTFALHRSTYPRVHVHHTPTVGVSVPPYHHRERGLKQDRSRSRSHGPRRRYVRFTDQPVVINLPASPPQNASSAPAPTRGRFSCISRTATAHAPTNSHPAATARQVSVSPAPTRSRPRHSGTRTAAAATAFGLHVLLASFPPGLWDMRRNARPPYHPEHQPHYSEPAFSPQHRKRSIKLQFRPCSRADLAWTATVKAAHCGKDLNVGDVLRAISTELLGRSVCREVREGDPCYEKARSAQRVRTRRGHTPRPHSDDALRNVDLYHVDHGTKLLFEGLIPERLSDGEVVYVVKFGCA